MADRSPLRRYVRALLEARVAGEAAAGQGLALIRHKASQNYEYVLYDPSVISDYMEHVGHSAGDSTPFDEVVASLDLMEIIYGYLEVRQHTKDCWKAGEVKFSAARKGYGPLMYELAMADFGRLMSDHGAGTSAFARVVWKKYSERPDVKALEFDDINDPKTPPPVDDCKLVKDPDGESSYLNNAYDGPGDASGVATMLRAHEAFVGQMSASYGFKPADVTFAIRMLGDEYFGKRYREAND